MSTVVTSLIELDENGVAWIIGANTKVVEVALDKIAYGWSVEEMHSEHPHLSLAHLHSALSYYYQNQVELDDAILRSWKEVSVLAAGQPDSPLRQRLRAAKYRGEST